jgi:hypothetical protein
MFSLPWSVFITWLFNNTKGSLLLVALFHGSEVWLVYLMGLKSKSLENLVGYGVIMILAAITIMLVAGPENFSRRYQRIADSHKLS